MLAQQLLNGLVAGAAYALFALGFNLMFGVLKVINLTYGFYFSVGAFLALFAARGLGAPIWLALPVAAIGAGIVATVLDQLLLTRLRRAKAPELASLMVTLGATLLLYSAMTATFGTDIRRLPPAIFDSAPLQLGGLYLTLSQMLILGTVAVLVVALIALMRGTRMGLAMRALAENPDAAQLMGVDTGRVVRFVSFLSGLLAGAAGVLMGLNYNAIQPYMGEAMMLKGFAVIIFGGLGDPRGAVVGGLAIGLLEALTAGYVSSVFKEAVGFLLLVLTLWVRPLGLFGRSTAKRA